MASRSLPFRRVSLHQDDAPPETVSAAATTAAATAAAAAAANSDSVILRMQLRIKALLSAGGDDLDLSLVSRQELTRKLRALGETAAAGIYPPSYSYTPGPGTKRNQPKPCIHQFLPHIRQPLKHTCYSFNVSVFHVPVLVSAL